MGTNRFSHIFSRGLNYDEKASVALLNMAQFQFTTIPIGQVFKGIALSVLILQSLSGARYFSTSKVHNSPILSVGTAKGPITPY